MKRRIHKLEKREDRFWLWLVDEFEGYFYTNKNGTGIFYDNPQKGIFRKQLTGTCQFIACDTPSGMRRKLTRWFEDFFPRGEF